MKSPVPAIIRSRKLSSSGAFEQLLNPRLRLHHRRLHMIIVHPLRQPLLIDIPKHHLNMAFSMRQPLRLTTILAGSSKTAFRSPAIRSFHSKPATNFFTSRTSTPINALTKARNAFRQSRNYQQPAATVPSGGNLMQKLVLGGALFGGTRKKPIFCRIFQVPYSTDQEDETSSRPALGSLSPK